MAPALLCIATLVSGPSGPQVYRLVAVRPAGPYGQATLRLATFGPPSSYRRHDDATVWHKDVLSWRSPPGAVDRLRPGMVLDSGPHFGPEGDRFDGFRVVSDPAGERLRAWERHLWLARRIGPRAARRHCYQLASPLYAAREAFLARCLRAGDAGLWPLACASVQPEPSMRHLAAEGRDRWVDLYLHYVCPDIFEHEESP